MGFSETNPQKKRPISWEFCGKIWDKFHQKTVIKKKSILWKFSGQVLLESDRFCAHFTNIFNETKQQFWGGGGGNDKR